MEAGGRLRLWLDDLSRGSPLTAVVYMRSFKRFTQLTGVKPGEQLLLVAGFSSEEVEKMDMNMSDEELQRKIRERLLGGMVNNGARQRIVSLEEVEKHISEGWEYVATLPNGKAILRIPV